MEPALWAQNALSPAESQHFAAHGYVVLDSVGLPAAQQAALGEMLRGDAVVSGFSSANSCGTEPALLELLTNHVALPKVAQLLDSTNFACTHAILRGDGCGSETVLAGAEALAAIDRELEMRPAPLIAVEALFVLGDDEGTNTPALICSPGSHLRDGDEPLGEGGVAVHVPKGGCVLLHRRLQRERLAPLTVAVGFGPRWLRAAGPMYVEAALQVATCPVLRQMLGWHSSNGARWMGLNDNIHDLPLLAWLSHHELPPGAGVPMPAPGWPLEIDAGSGFPGGIEGDDGHASYAREEETARL